MLEQAPYGLSVDDDLRHLLGDDPTTGESIALTVALPDDRLYLVVHGRVEPGDEASHLIGAFGPDGLVRLDAGRGKFEGDDFDDASFDGLHVTQPQRSRTMGMAYDGDGVRLQCDFEAMHPMFGFGANVDGCCPVLADDRSEQAGLVRGSITIDDREVPFDTTGHRDHSWGPRDYRALFHWKWVSLQAGPETAVHVTQAWYQGQTWLNGYVLRGGELSPVTSCRARMAFDDDMIHRSAELRLVDELGRQTLVEAERFAAGIIPIPGTSVVETGCRCSIAGQEGAGGVELAWSSDYHDYLRTSRHEPVV